MWSNMRMVNRLGLVFGIAILMLGGANLLAIKNLNSLTGLIDKLYNHPFTVSTSVLNANVNIIAMHRSMKDVVLAMNERQLQDAINIVNQTEKEVYDDFERINDRFLGDKTLVSDVLRAFKDWKPIRDEVIALMKAGKNEKAAAITKEKGAKHVALLNNSIKVLVDFAMNKAKEFQEETKKTNSDAQLLVITMFVVALVIGVVLAYSTTRIIQKQVGGDPSEIEHLAKKVAEGDFNIEFKDEEQTGILKALLSMAQSLKRNAKRNEEINWFQKSSVELSLCMRGEQSLEQLGQNLCSFLVKKTDAIAGRLYVAGDNGILTLIGGYAIDEKKNDSQKIELGQGIAGQAFLDKQSIIIDQLPKDYMRTKTGTVEIELGSLLVFPFIWNDRVRAIVELGTVNKFTKLHLEFLKQEAITIVINITSTKSRD